MIGNTAIRRPVTTIVVFLILAIFGIYGYLQMPVQENPDVEFPIVSVNVVLAGASPDVIESEIIEPLEAEINTIEGLRQLSSTASEQVGFIIAEFELWRDLDIAAQDVRDAVDRAQRQLPLEAEAPVVRKLELGAQPIMWIALTGDERWGEVRLTEFAEQVIRRQLETVRGVGQIIVGGARDYAVRIRLDPDRLAALQVTVQDVITTIQTNNVDIPSGRIEGGQREFLIQTRGQFEDAAPFNDLIVAHRHGTPIRLRDVGQAVDDVENDRQLARFAGEMTVGLGVVKQAGANTIELAETLRERMATLAETFPAGLAYTIATDDSEYVQESIRDLRTTIGIATLLVMLVVFGFLRSGRGTIVTLVAIPTSLFIGLAGIHLLGFSINVVSMLGFILVIGIIIDDAIVVLERVHLHMDHGAEAEPAARVGTTEVAFPIIANSLALGAVFLPVAFTGGLIGQFFLEFGLTVAVTVFASTFVALTLTPVLCAKLLRVSPHKGRLHSWSEKGFNRVERFYGSLLGRALIHRWLTIGIGAGAFALGLLALANVPREFAPMEDRASFMISFETPQGATIGQTDQFAAEIERILGNMPEVEHQFLAIGLGFGGPGRPNQGRVFVRLVPRHEREDHQEQVMQTLRQHLGALPYGRAFVSEGTPGGIGGSPIEIALQHPDIDELDQQQDLIIRWMERQTDLYIGVQSNLELNRPQVEVVLDRDRASEMGLSVAEISNTLRYLFGNPTISSVERDAQRYDVITDIEGRGRLSPDVLRTIYVRGPENILIALDAVVELSETIGLSEIHRFNRLRSATISAQTPPGVALGNAVDRLEVFLASELPAGASYELTGMSQLFEESFYYLAVALALSIVFIYLVLAAQFESFIHPFTIMLALPLATVGAFGGLWLLGLNLNIYAFIGLIMLLGLVTKNSILLVDYANVLTIRGLSALEAARRAAAVRFRPVLMTAISTVLGMMPIALGFGAGGEARIPLGVAVAAGLFGATFLTLVVVPVAFVLIDQGIAALRRRFRQPDTDPTPLTTPKR